MRYQNFILLICLPQLAWFQRIDCDDNQKRTIRFIEEEINHAHDGTNRRTRWKCSFYGVQDPSSVNLPGHRLLHHKVCHDWFEHSEKYFVEATITPEDLKGQKGRKINPKVAENLKDLYDECGCDEGGHIVPNSFGGQGYAANIFPQNANLNRNLWNKVCNEVSEFLTPQPTRFAIMRMAFEYKDLYNFRRPSLYYYSFGFYGDGKVYDVYGFFENQDHSGLELQSCWDGDKKYNFAIPNLKYFNRRSCRPKSRRHNMYGPNITP